MGFHVPADWCAHKEMIHNLTSLSDNLRSSCISLAVPEASRPQGPNKSQISHSPFFARQKKFFFSCGATPSRTVPKTQPLQVAFSLRERVDLRSQKEGILGKRIARGRVRRTGQKRKKDAQNKKRWVQTDSKMTLLFYY